MDDVTHIAGDGRRYADCGEDWPTCLRIQADMMGLTDWSIESYGGTYWLMPPAMTVTVVDPKTGQPIEADVTP